MKMRELLEEAEIGQTELATWLKVAPRSIRRYVNAERRADPALILLLEYLVERPEAISWFRDRAARKP